MSTNIYLQNSLNNSIISSGFENNYINPINFLNSQMSANDYRIIEGIKKFISLYPKSKIPLLFEFLTINNGLCKKIVETNVYRAFNKTPKFLPIKLQNKNNNDTTMTECINTFIDYLNAPLNANIQSIEFEKTRAIIEAQKLGGSFLVLCVDKKDDDLTQPLDLNNPEALYKDTLGGNIYCETVSLVNNNRYDVQSALDLFELKDYFNKLSQQDTTKEIKIIQKKIENYIAQHSKTCAKIKNFLSDSEDTLNLMLTRGRMLKVHKSRIITYISTNTSISQLSNQLFGFGFSVLEPALDSILHYQSLLLDLIDVSKRAAIFKLEKTSANGATGYNTPILSQEIIEKQQKLAEQLGQTNFNSSIFLAPEGYNLVSTSTDFKGLADVIEMALKNIAVQTNYSKQDLEGEGAKGFSNGEDIAEQTAGHIEYVRNYFKPKNEFLYKVIFANQFDVKKYGYNSIHTISLQYDNLRQENPKDKVERIRLTKEILESLKDRGAINEKQLVESINTLGILPNALTYAENIDSLDETDNINNIKI